MKLEDVVNKILDFVERYAKVLFVANLVVICALWGFVGLKKAIDGYVFQKDISISGGTLVIINYHGLSIDQVKAVLSGKNYNIYSTGGMIYIEGKKLDVNNLISELNSKLGTKITKNDYEVREFSPYFGSMIFSEFTRLLIISLMLITIVIFIRMRNWISSLAILMTILFDLGAAVSFLAITGYPISVISFVAFLMILGYAIDNNIVLATNIFKEEGEFREKVKLSLKVGYLMEMTTMIVLAIIYIFINSKIIHELAMVLLIALVADAYFYLFGNVPFYKYIIQKKES
jgi:preprotein translocase subunit SecF